MSEQEILEGNKLIVKFMELIDDIPHDHQGITPYHLDWNWLMPVIDKIEDLDVSDSHYKWEDLDGITRSNFGHFEFEMDRKSDGYSSRVWMELQLDPVEVVAGHHEKEYPTRIESAWNTVVEFIKYYNSRY